MKTETEIEEAQKLRDALAEIIKKTNQYYDSGLVISECRRIATVALMESERVSHRQ